MRGGEIRKTPTVYDVAQAAGVSTATVSFTFRRPERVKASTREAVQTAARTLGYVPSASARGLAAGRTGAIGLVTWDLLGPRRPGDGDGPPATSWETPGANDRLRLYPRYVDEVQHGIELAAWRQGYALMMGSGNHENNEAVIIDIAGRVDGLVILPHTISAATIQLIADRIPVVVMSETDHALGLSTITVDNAGGIRDLVDHLVQQHDARRLEFCGSADSVEIRLRFRAFRAALAAMSLPVPVDSLEHDGNAGRLADRLTAAGLPDAVLCGTDADALELMDALAARGVRVPEDVIVTGFDGIAAGQISTPRLTTVRQPMHAMGVAAVELLIEQLADRDRALPVRQFPVDLVVRESCGCRNPSS